MKVEVMDRGRVVFSGGINDDALPADFPEAYKDLFNSRPKGVGLVEYVRRYAGGMGNMTSLPNDGIKIIER